MRKSGLIICFTLLLAATGIRGIPVVGSVLESNVTSLNDNSVGVLTNKTAEEAPICGNGTSADCSPTFDSIIGVIQNASASGTKDPFDGSNAANWTCGWAGRDNSSLSASGANYTTGNSSVPRCAVIQRNVSSVNGSAVPCKNGTHCSNATSGSASNSTYVTRHNATFGNDTTADLMLKDQEAPITSETVDGNSSVCPPIVSRAGWGGKPPRGVDKLKTPVQFVVIHHTYIPDACNTSDDCEDKMRSMQDSHMGKGWLNIGYNFIVGGDNRIYCGRGWDVVGAHSPTYNFKSIGISFIGDYRTELPTQEMMELSWSLIRCGIARGSISETYKLVGHRQVRDTECPGDRLYQEIQTWPHWVPHRDIIPRTNKTTSS